MEQVKQETEGERLTQVYVEGWVINRRVVVVVAVASQFIVI